MKILFVHDHKFKKADDEFYSSGGLPCSIWPRYTSTLGELTVIGRDGGLLAEADKGFTRSSTEFVSFQLLPDIANIKSLLWGNREVRRAACTLISRHDAVIARVPSRLGTLFVKEAIKQGKPYALEVVGCPWDAMWNYGGLKGKLFAPYAALELKSLAAKSKFALYVTEFFLQSRYPAPNRAITTFCSNVEIPPVDDSVLVDRLDKISGCVVGEVVTFGLIANYSSRYKGIDVAIKALKQANLPRWQLKVLGSGDATYYSRLASDLGVADKVNFVGSLPSGGPVFEWVDSIDIYLHPSFQEGLPRALIEAMSRGAPALASKIAGIPELLNDSELIAAGDHNNLAKKITKLATDKTLQATLAEHNFNKAKSYYREVLNFRRMSFWHQFRQHVEG